MTEILGQRRTSYRVQPSDAPAPHTAPVPTADAATVAVAAAAAPQQVAWPVWGQKAMAATSTHPDLPDPVGAVLDGSELRDKMVWAGEIEHAADLWHALMTLADQSRLDILLSKKLKYSLQRQKIVAKGEEISEASEKIIDDRASSWFKFAFQVGGAVASVYMGFKGASARGPMGPALSASAMITGFTFGAAQDAMDKEFGPQRWANEHMINEKEWQRFQEIIDQVTDEMRSNEEEAREAFRAAIRVINEHIDRSTDIIRKIAS